MFKNEGNSRFSLKVRFLQKSSLILVASECPGLAKIFVNYQINLFHLSIIWPSGKFMTIGQDVFLSGLFSKRDDLNFKKVSWELESVGIDIPTVALASWGHPLHNQALISNQPNDFLYPKKY